MSINIGLGRGSRDKDMSTLLGLAQKQELAIQGLQSPFNPICNVAHLFTTYRKAAEVAGIKMPEEFFPELTQQDVMQMAQQQAQQQKPPPEVMKIQADMQLGQQKLQSDTQMKQMEIQGKMQGDNNRAELDRRQAEQKAQKELIQAQADVATQQRKAETEATLAQQRFDLESDLKQQEFAMNLGVQARRVDCQAFSAARPGRKRQSHRGRPGRHEMALAQLDNSSGNANNVTLMPSKRDETTSRP